jgi:hypothetical protein
MAYNRNFIVITRNIGVISILMLHVWKSLIWNKDIDSSTSIIMRSSSQLQHISDFLCSYHYCRYSFQAIYSWWSLKVQWNCTPCTSPICGAEKIVLQNLNVQIKILPLWGRSDWCEELFCKGWPALLSLYKKNVHNGITELSLLFKIFSLYTDASSRHVIVTV